MRFLRVALAVLGIIQIANGIIYLAAPSSVATMLGVGTAAPHWVDFVLATCGARNIGYGIGLLVAARTPRRHQLWITAMLAIQIIDFVAALAYIADGSLPLQHVGPLAALPLLWVVVLGGVYLRSREDNRQPRSQSTLR